MSSTNPVSYSSFPYYCKYKGSFRSSVAVILCLSKATKTLSENACRAFFMFTGFDVASEIMPFNTIDNGLFMTFTFVYFCASDLLMSSTGLRFRMTLLNKCLLDVWFICPRYVILHVLSLFRNNGNKFFRVFFSCYDFIHMVVFLKW